MRGAPVAPALQSTRSNLSGDLLAKTSATFCCSSCRILTVKPVQRSKASQLAAVVAMHTRTSGGSSDTEVNEPIVMPTNPVEITMPSAPGPSPHSFVIPGPANVMARMSNPSSAFSAMQMTTATIWPAWTVSVTSRRIGRGASSYAKTTSRNSTGVAFLIQFCTIGREEGLACIAVATLIRAGGAGKR